MIDFSTVEDIVIPEGKVKSITRNGVILWSVPVTESSLLPSEYQQVEWIKAAKNVQAYINLGFTFDTSATIYIEQFLDNAPTYSSTESTYLFGSTDSTGNYRCMLTSPGNAHGTFIYGANGSSYTNCQGKYVYQGKNCLKLVYKKGDAHWENLDTGEISVKQTSNIEFTLTNPLYLLAQNYKGSVRFNATNGHERCVGRFSYYDKNDVLICDLYPCYRKSDGVIGMYDIVRNTFLINAGSGTFTKGADVA